MEEYEACPQQQGELTQCCTLSSGVLRCPANMCPTGYFVSFTSFCRTSSEETTTKQEEETAAFYSPTVMATTSASVSVTAESLRESSRITTSEMVQNTSSTKVTSGQMPSTLTSLTTSSENSPMTAAGFTMTGEVREETTPNGTAYVTCCQDCINCTANQSENDQHKTSIPIISGVVIGCLILLALFTFLVIWKRKKSRKDAYEIDNRLSQRPGYEEDINRHSFSRFVKINVGRPIVFIAKGNNSKTETTEVYEEIALSPQSSHTRKQASNGETLTNPCHYLQPNKIVIGDDIDDQAVFTGSSIRPDETCRKKVELHRGPSMPYYTNESAPVNRDRDEYRDNDAVKLSWPDKRDESREGAQRGVNSETLIYKGGLCNSLGVLNTSIDSSTKDLPLKLSAENPCPQEGQSSKDKMYKGKGPLSSFKSYHPIRRSRWHDSIKAYKDSVESADSGIYSSRESWVANDDGDLSSLKDQSVGSVDSPEECGSRESLTNAHDSYYTEEQDFLHSSKSTQTVLKNILPDPVLSEDWQFSNEFSVMGGKLQGNDSDVILEIPVGGIGKDEVVTIHGAVSTDLNKAYSKLDLPKDEVIVSPIVEYFAGLGFTFQKAVKIVLPSFMPPNVSLEHIHVYQFHSENNKVHCYRLQTLNTNMEHFEVDTYGRQIHIVTHHFSGYLCTVCEKACADYTKPHDITLQVYAKHVLRDDNTREVIVRLDMWDARFSIKDFQKPPENSTKNRQMLLITREKLPRLPAGVEVEGIEVGGRLGMGDTQKDLWTHVTDGATVLKPVLQTMELNRFYPSRCHTMDFPCCFSWELQNQTDILPQMEFECFVYVGYISPKERARTADDTNIFMTDVPPVGITVRRAKEFDADYRCSLMPDGTSGSWQTHHIPSRQSSISFDSVLSPSECHHYKQSGQGVVRSPSLNKLEIENVQNLIVCPGAVSPMEEQPSSSTHPKEQPGMCQPLQPQEELCSHVLPNTRNSTSVHDNMKRPVQVSNREDDLNQSHDF
ncbi:uncharacterized protein LOC112561223 isoform X2 [Pomacea canaliculata]|nr:uncharacterized protein LOC112561223 isoform X2 [Pomacea canaliculata]